MGQSAGQILSLSSMSRPSACIRWMCRRFCASFETLIESGATVIVIEHDLDVIRSADYIIDMGPGGGSAGGKIVACRHTGRDCRKPRKRNRKVFRKALKASSPAFPENRFHLVDIRLLDTNSKIRNFGDSSISPESHSPPPNGENGFFIFPAWDRIFLDKYPKSDYTVFYLIYVRFRMFSFFIEKSIFRPSVLRFRFEGGSFFEKFVCRYTAYRVQPSL